MEDTPPPPAVTCLLHVCIHQTFDFLQLTSLSILFLIEWTCVGVWNRSSRWSYYIYWLQTNGRTGFLRSEYIIVKCTCKTWIRLHTTIVKSRANLAKLGKNNFSAFPTELGKKPWGVFPSTAGKARKLRLFPLRFGSDIEFWQKDKKKQQIYQTIQIVMLLPFWRGHKS